MAGLANLDDEPAAAARPVVVTIVMNPDVGVTSDVVVIGAGWAGLTAALRLAESGYSVTVLDAAPQAGGRARTHRLSWPHPDFGDVTIDVDNGQHLLIGAYVETLGLLERLGALGADRAERLPLQIVNNAGLAITRRRMPLLEPLTPLLALATARGLPATARWALLRTLATARLRSWRPPAGVRTVADWYHATRQPEPLVRLLWQPLVVSTMNTPADEACASTFLTVLRDSLGGTPAATDFVLPKQSLGTFFVDPVCAALARHGGHLLLRHDVRRIERGRQRRYRLVIAARPNSGRPDRATAELESGLGTDSTAGFETDRIVIATPPVIAARLLQPLAARGLIDQLQAFRYLPITTAWAGWSAPRLAGARGLPPVLALTSDPGRGHHAHWLFDRGRHGPWRVGALVISDSRAAREHGADGALNEALAGQLATDAGLPAPEQLTLIHEKRATFACTPERPRLDAASALDRLPGIVLAGDYAWPDYPATLEGAVRSGLAAARAVCADPAAA